MRFSRISGKTTQFSGEHSRECRGVFPDFPRGFWLGILSGLTVGAANMCLPRSLTVLLLASEAMAPPPKPMAPTCEEKKAPIVSRFAHALRRQTPHIFSKMRAEGAIMVCFSIRYGKRPQKIFRASRGRVVPFKCHSRQNRPAD